MVMNFQELFRGMEPKYISALFDKMKTSRINELTQLEREMCVLLWMNFDNYEIAQLLNIEVADVELERERVRQKLDIEGGITIQGFMQQNLA